MSLGIQYTPIFFDPKLIGGKEFSIFCYHLTLNSLEARNSVYFIIFYPKLIRGKVPIQYATFYYPKLIKGKEFSTILQ